MKRRLFTSLSVLSLLLFVAVVVLWVRSYWCTDVFAYSDDPTRIQSFICDSGQAMAHWSEGPLVSYHLAREGITKGGVAHRVSRPRGRLHKFVPLDRSIDYRFGGFGFVGGQRGRNRERAILLPLWFAAVLFSLLPALRLNRLIKDTFPQSEGRCPVCDYDLRATPERCPECGHKPDSPVGWIGIHPSHSSKTLLSARRKRQA